MAKILRFPTYLFIQLCWLILRALTDLTTVYVLEPAIFVDHGLRNVTSVSVMQCLVGCMWDDSCMSLSYNGVDRICQLNYGNPLNDANIPKISIDGWTSFYDKGQCRDDWQVYEGSCYHVVPLSKDWPSSEFHCQKLGGHLTDIHNTDENEFLRNFVTNVSDTGNYWIGYNDLDEDGYFSWSSSVPNDYQVPMLGAPTSPPLCVYKSSTVDYCSPGNCFTNLHSVCKAFH